MLRTGHRSMRAVRTGLVWFAALVAGGCSMSLDGDHFLGDPVDPDGGPAGRPDARAPGSGQDDPPDPPDDGEDGDDDDATTCADACAGGDCDLTCPERACDCELDCAATFKTCKPKCEHHDCAIDCREVDKCEALCKDADCTIDCTGARECDHIKCEDGSGCLLDCTGAEKCEFDVCEGEVTSCPGDRLACNRPCP